MIMSDMLESCAVVWLMDIIAVWFIDIFSFSAGLRYVLYVSHKLISSSRVLAFL